MANRDITGRPIFAALLALLMLGNSSMAAQTPGISDLSALDRQYLEIQQQAIDDLARRHLGRQLNHNTENNLSILQALLDRQLVRPGQTQVLQSMGVVLGNRLATDLSMHWVIAEDRYGRSRALRLGLTDNLLFPITMISRRAEVGAQVSTRAIYQKARDIMAPYIEKGPFQYD